MSRRRAVSRAGRPPPPCVGADACIGPPAGLTNGGRLRVSARLRPQCRAGDFARRGALRHRRVCGTMQASSPTKHRARSCPILQDISVANLPGGRERPPYNARQTGGGTGDGRRCPRCRAVSRAGRPPPCVGADACIGPWSGLTNGGRLCVTARSRRLCRAGDFARRGALRHRRASETMQASSPTKHRAKPCRVWRMFARAGEAGLPGRLKNQPHRAAHGAAGQNQFAREPPGRYTGAGGAVFAALTPRRPSP